MASLNRVGLPPAGTETPGAVLLEPGTRPWDGVTP